MTQIVLSGFSRTEIEQKIDDFLAKKPLYSTLDLVVPVGRARRFEYKGLSVREWRVSGNTRYDTAVDVVEKKA